MRMMFVCLCVCVCVCVCVFVCVCVSVAGLTTARVKKVIREYGSYHEDASAIMVEIRISKPSPANNTHVNSGKGVGLKRV